MLTVRIKAWNYPGFVLEGQAHDESLLFDKTLDDPAIVQSLYEQFSQLVRGPMHVRGPLLPGHRYEFRFSDGAMTVVYQGTSHYPVWHVYTGASGQHRETVPVPDAVLRSLHDSIGLPWDLPVGHR